MNGEARICEWCGEVFVATPGPSGSGLRRRFCTENCRKAACDDRHRKPCPECGELMGVRSGWPRAGQSRRRCRQCEVKRQARRVDERAQLIIRWWAEGLSMLEIRERLGWSHGHLSVEMARLRDKGYDLPYRYKRKKHGVRAAG